MIWYYIISCVTSLFIFGWYFVFVTGDYLDTLEEENRNIDSEAFISCGFYTLLTGDFVLLFVDLCSFMLLDLSKFYYILSNKVFWGIFLGTGFLVILVSLLIRHENKTNPIYIKAVRTMRIKEHMEKVRDFLDRFEREKRSIRDDCRISKEQKEESISILDSYIKLLKDIYGELRISLSMAEMNYATQQFKDIELSETNLESLSKQIDKMKAYRSLGEVSQELQELLKKYDSGKVEKVGKK